MILILRIQIVSALVRCGALVLILYLHLVTAWLYDLRTYEFGEVGEFPFDKYSLRL